MVTGSPMIVPKIPASSFKGNIFTKGHIVYEGPCEHMLGFFLLQWVLYASREK